MIAISDKRAFIQDIDHFYTLCILEVSNFGRKNNLVSSSRLDSFDSIFGELTAQTLDFDNVSGFFAQIFVSGVITAFLKLSADFFARTQWRFRSS